MNESGIRRALPDQTSGSGHTFDTSHHPSVTSTILSKRVCFYKSGDPQFSGFRVVINNRTFKTFDALLDSLSKKVPLPFGVRNITTPRGIHGISTLDELEDGKSYICSDSRKVKPIDLSLARRRLPPWYHARPVSSRRRTARVFPGRTNIHREDPVVIRTPKKLVVFRNGDPSVRHTVLLRRKTTPSYESILRHISELMQFHVNKLHTPDGRRIDGLPGLIMCSGSVVAVGRETFRPAVYSAEKSPSPTRQPTKRRAYKRQKASVSKKTTPSFFSKSRNFSASSERYIVHQIQNSIAESSCDLPTNSTESGSDRILESLTETEEDTCLANAEGDGAQDCVLPNDDNIEKSFRVNDDGSMTVEMKVRLTIKEEETVQWTTTLTRSVVADGPYVACLPEQEVCSNNSQASAASTDIIQKDRTRDDDDDPPSLGNGVYSESFQEESSSKEHSGGVLARRAPTPGRKKISKLQTSVESIKSVTVDEFREGSVGSCVLKEETQNRTTTQQFYLENQNSSRPVPKPRRLGFADVNTRDISGFKSTEIMETESSGEEVTETVLHIYEQQSCHDNFLPNVIHGMSASGATSESRQLCYSNEVDLDFWRPSPASEPVTRYKTDSTSLSSDSHLSTLKPGAIRGPKRELQQSTKSHDMPGNDEVKNDPGAYTNPKGDEKHVRLVMTPGKGQKKRERKVPEKHKGMKPFSSAMFIKRIYGNKTNSPKKIKKIKRRATPTWNSLPKPNAKKANNPLSSKEMMNIFKTKTETSHPQRELTLQTEKESLDISKDKPLHQLNNSTSIAKEYVKNWLEKANSSSSSKEDKGSKIADVFTPAQTHKKVETFLEETTENRKIFELSSPENAIAPSVKLRVQSFENKSTPAAEKNTRLKNTDNYTTKLKTENYNSLSQKDTQVKPVINGIYSEILPPRTETAESGEEGSMATHSSTLFMALPPPPPELLNAEDFTNNSVSVTCSPMSSQRSDNYQLSLSPASDHATSPDDSTMDRITSSQSKNPPVQQGTELSRAPSIKRAPLVSNGSLEKQMLLRKATLDKYASHNNATEEGTALSAPINTLQQEVCSIDMKQQINAMSEETQQPILELGTPSICSSVSPLSLTSDGRMSSSSIASSETSVMGNISFQETKGETQSPKSLIKREKPKSSPSPERKIHKKRSAELQNTSPKLSPMTKHLLDKQDLSNKGPKKPATPNASPSTERKHHETKELQRTSLYSQSLDVASPPGGHKPSKKLLSGNLSLDSPSESKNRKLKKRPSQKESLQTSQMGTDNCDEIKVTGDQAISVIPEPNMKPILENICYSIKSIRQITKNKRPSCLEKSNSLPDFSSHVASTFGSSSKVLLAFLAVMTLKEGLTSLNMKELNANNVSCAEALKMIDSLKEIANIEDSQRLRTSLSDLQQSASVQLLQSWKGFQELGEYKTRNATPNASEAETGAGAEPELECDIANNVIDDIIESLDIPQKLKEELVSLSEGAEDELDDGGNMHSGRLKQLPEQHINENTKHISTEDCIAPNDEHNADVRTTVKKITNITQPKLSEMHRIALLSETAKYKSMGQAMVDDGDQDWSNSVANPSTSINLQLCMDVEDEGHLEKQKQDEQAYLNEKLPQERAEISGDVCRGTEPVKQDRYMDCRQLPQKEKEILKTELTQVAKSALDEETRTILSASQDCREQGTEKRAEEISSSSNLDSLSTEMQPSSTYYVEVDVKREKTTFNSGGDKLHEGDPAEIQSKVLPNEMCSMGLSMSTNDSTGSSDPEEPSSEEEQPEVDCKELQEEEPAEIESRASLNEMCSMGLDIRTNDSTGSSDVDEPSSEEEQPKVECKKLHVIFEESFSGNEEEEGEPLCDLPRFSEQTKKGRELEALTEEPEEDQISSEDETQYADELEQQSSPERGLNILLESSDLCGKEEESSLIISGSLGKSFKFNTDDDSGNDHSSFEEHVNEVQLNNEEKHTSSLIEEELSYYEKDTSSEEEQVSKDRKIRESFPQSQGTPQIGQQEEPNVNESPERQSDAVTTQSVAERVTLLEMQAAEAQKSKLAPKSSTIRCVSQRKTPLVESGDSPSESPTSDLTLCTRSAPQSSLSFSYDSSGVITTEPEGNRVRSIREMFLARSATDIQQRGPNLSEPRGETSGSGGYQSQTSSDLSNGEDDSVRKSISKGFVRRAIEMLYGKKDPEPEESSERPPSESDERKREPSSLFSPFQAARSKAMSEFSYFNSSNALDIFSEATKCIAFNAQVGPGDSISIDDGRWLVRENTSMRKSVSDPAGIHKTFINTFQHEDTEEKSPYSLFSTKPELEDEAKSQPGKCTYFSLPYASESEVCQEETSTVSKSSKNEGGSEETKDASEDSKTWAERNGSRTDTGLADLKMKGNKVHPLVEMPPDGEVVVMQPGKGQIVNRRVQEPDVLDLLYTFCGEHCPIL